LTGEFGNLTDLLEVLDEILGNIGSVFRGNLELGVDILDGLYSKKQKYG
jgi:hypothetical protein